MEIDNYEKIDLVKFFKVIIKRKKLFLFSFIICCLAIFCVYFVVVKTRINSVEAVIEVGETGENQIENVIQLVEGINRGFFGQYPSLSARTIPNTRLIELTISSVKEDEGKENLSKVISAITSELDLKNERAKESVKNLQESINKNIGVGQQTAVLQLELLKMQQDIEGSSLLRTVQNPRLLPVKKMSPFLIFIVTVTLGILVGFVVIFAKEWWVKNKPIFMDSL